MEGEHSWFLANLFKKTPRKMERGAFMMHLVHAVLLNFCVELQKKHIYSAPTLIRFLPAKYEVGDSGLQKFEDVESSEMGCMGSKSSELVAVEDSIVLKQESKR